jgi:hypothetical protein
MSLNLIVNRRVWKGSAAELTANAKKVFEAGDEIYQTGDFSRVKIADGVTALSSLPWSETPQSNHTAATANETETLTAAKVKTGYITSTSAAATSLTLPSAESLIEVLPGSGAGTWFDLAIDNSAGANTVTVVASASITAATAVVTGGDTLTVAAGAVGLFRIYFSSGTVAKIYRIG